MKVNLDSMEQWKPDPILPKLPVFEEGKDGVLIAKFEFTNGSNADFTVVSSEFVPVNTIVVPETGQVFKMVDGELVEVKDEDLEVIEEDEWDEEDSEDLEQNEEVVNLIMNSPSLIKMFVDMAKENQKPPEG